MGLIRGGPHLAAIGEPAELVDLAWRCGRSRIVSTCRDDLPSQLGPGGVRNDVGVGLRIYVKAVVLPLLGLDLGHGIEGHSPEVYFEVGLTDF